MTDPQPAPQDDVPRNAAGDPVDVSFDAIAVAANGLLTGLCAGTTAVCLVLIAVTLLVPASAVPVELAPGGAPATAADSAALARQAVEGGRFELLMGGVAASMLTAAIVTYHRMALLGANYRRAALALVAAVGVTVPAMLALVLHATASQSALGATGGMASLVVLALLGLVWGWRLSRRTFTRVPTA